MPPQPANGPRKARQLRLRRLHRSRRVDGRQVLEPVKLALERTELDTSGPQQAGPLVHPQLIGRHGRPHKARYARAHGIAPK